MEQRRIKVQWTEPARDALATLNKKSRRAILDKVGKLAECDNPRTDLNTRLLRGPGILQGYYRLRVGRHRVVYAVNEERLPNGDVFCIVTITVLYVGMRKAGDKKDVYRLAEKLIKFGSKIMGEDEDNENKGEDKSTSS